MDITSDHERNSSTKQTLRSSGEKLNDDRSIAFLYEFLNSRVDAICDVNVTLPIHRNDMCFAKFTYAHSWFSRRSQNFTIQIQLQNLIQSLHQARQKHQQNS